MKIVHVISGYLPDDSGGTEHQALSLTKDSWEDVPVTRLINNFLDCDRFELLYSHPAIDRRFDSFLADEQPDVVHIQHLTYLSTSMIEVAKTRGVSIPRCENSSAGRVTFGGCSPSATRS